MRVVGSPTDPTSLIQFGVLGIILMLVLFGFLWAKPSVDRLIKDKEAAEKQRDDLLSVYQTQVIPVLTEVKDHVVPGLRDVMEGQRQIRDEQSELRKSVDAMLRERRSSP